VNIKQLAWMCIIIVIIIICTEMIQSEVKDKHKTMMEEEEEGWMSLKVLKLVLLDYSLPSCSFIIINIKQLAAEQHKRGNKKKASHLGLSESGESCCIVK